MAISKKVFIETKFAENTETTQYAAGDVFAEIQAFTVRNNGGVSADLSIFIVPPSTTRATQHIVQKITVPAGKDAICDRVLGQALQSGGSIDTLASLADVLTIRCTGIEIT